MNKDVPFRRVSKILQELGFQLTSRGPQRFFVHPDDQTLIALTVDQGRIREILIKGVGRILDERGFMDRDEFERRIYYANGAVTSR